MIRISTTTLESYRLWRDPEQEWMSEDELLETIRGVFAPDRQMLLGQAFGRGIEKPEKYRGNGGYLVPVRIGDQWEKYWFEDAVMSPALERFDRRGVFEAKATKTYGECVVVVKADHIIGAHINEIKATTKYFNFDKYADSCQWRFLLDIFGAHSLEYHVFELTDDVEGIELRRIETLKLYPYPALSQDCMNLLDDFVGYVKARGLYQLLEERQLAFKGA